MSVEQKQGRSECTLRFGNPCRFCKASSAESTCCRRGVPPAMLVTTQSIGRLLRAAPVRYADVAWQPTTAALSPSPLPNVRKRALTTIEAA